MPGSATRPALASLAGTRQVKVVTAHLSKGGQSGDVNRSMAELPTLDEIRADFELLDNWEDRYRYVIELGRALAPLADADRTEANKVRGCASQVWLRTSVDTGQTPPVLRFAGDSDAHIVKGLIAILFVIFSDRPAPEILAQDAHATFRELGLAEHLTPQRSNGFASMVTRVRTDAEAALGHPV